MTDKMSWASSKYEEIISKFHRGPQGPPVYYQLSSPNNQSKGDIRRVTLGEKDESKFNKTILVVGETGTGKSTLINAMVNYVMGVEWEHEVFFEMVEVETKGQSESQTSEVTIYEIFGFEGVRVPYSITIIDSPGYGDTRGIEQDAVIRQQLCDLFRSEKGIQDINVIGFVLKSSENRLSDRLTYIFDSVVSLFGKNMEKNIVALITHSNGMPPKNTFKVLDDTKMKCARNDKNQPVHFLFDNCQLEPRAEDTDVPLENAWRVTKRGMDRFFTFLGDTSSQKMQTTVEVLNSRIRLTACIHNLQQRMESIELKQTEIKQTQEALMKHEAQMVDNSSFKMEVDEVYKDKRTITAWWDSKAVCCTVCKETCHYPGCTLAWSPYMCEVMKDEHCTSCTKKCHYSSHVKEDWRYINKTRRVTKTLDDVRDKYLKNKDEVEKTKSLLPILQNKMEELRASKAQWLEEAYQHVVTLEKIALNANSLSTQVHLDFLIEKMKETGSTEKIRKLEEMKSRVDSRAMQGLLYVLSKVKHAFSYDK